jgi:hypothetical protein
MPLQTVSSRPTSSGALDAARACHERAARTPDLDHHALLSFLAEGWQKVAQTGDPASARPAFLRAGGFSEVRARIRLHG